MASEMDFECEKCGEPSPGKHSCPYEAERGNADPEYCTCCDECMEYCSEESEMMQDR